MTLIINSIKISKVIYSSTVNINFIRMIVRLDMDNKKVQIW